MTAGQAGGDAHVVVVGGGIAGLAAAHDLLTAPGPGLRVTLLEGGPGIGGKLKVSEVAGMPVDEGAEAMLARRPEGLELAGELGLDLVYPGTTNAAIWSRGALRPLPAGHVMGIPTDLRALARSKVLSPGGVLRVPLDTVRGATPRDGDVAVADFVGSRLGRQVVDRLVEPLLGGVYAGRVEDLSFEATLPSLASASRSHRSLLAAARSVREAAPKDPGPVFASVPGGLGELATALEESIVKQGGIVRTKATVRELRRTTEGWRLTVGPTRAPEAVAADAVILAVPARPASRLLAEEAGAASAELGQIDYASMAIVTLVYRETAFPRLPAGSGYLVPAVEETGVKAVTFTTTKWPHVAQPETVVVRCSIGRYGEEPALQRADADLVTTARNELARTCRVRDQPLDSRVSRWGGGLPQYTVGHVARVARIRAAVDAHPGLAVCGAAYDGVGIPACISTARKAAASIRAALEEPPGDGRMEG